jgi:hypothetical protein
MTTRRPTRGTRKRRPLRTAGEQSLMRLNRRTNTVSFQWHDGAGEVHFHQLSHAQSWPYLQERE